MVKVIKLRKIILIINVNVWIIKNVYLFVFFFEEEENGETTFIVVMLFLLKKVQTVF